MMVYNDLDTRTIRERADMSQLWATWIVADDLRRQSFRGSLGWEVRSGHEYLYSRKRGFGAPIREWFRGAGGETLGGMIMNSSIRRRDQDVAHEPAFESRVLLEFPRRHNRAADQEDQGPRVDEGADQPDRLPLDYVAGEAVCLGQGRVDGRHEYSD